MVLRKITLLLVLFLTVNLLFAQSKEEKKAMAALNSNKYAKAITLFKNAFVKTKDPARIANISFNTGLAYMKINNPKQAEAWFTKALKVRYPDPIAILYLADMKKKNGKFEEAIATYKRFGRNSPGDKRVTIGVKSCQLAAKWVEHPTRYEVENMPIFNSKDMDFSPTWGKKNFSIVYFSSTRSGSKGDNTNAVTGFGFTDIYSVTRDRKGRWSEPVPLTGDGVNTDDDEGASCTNSKGSIMYFTRCKVVKNRSEGCEIYKSQKRGVVFGDATLLSFPGSDTVSYGHPAISADDLILYFAADLPGGYGGHDIWMLKRKKKNGKFGSPINLGPQINTPGEELYPTVRSNGVLYFSSDYHIGMGGLDIFRAVKNKETGKYKVVNMKYPINSAADDFSIIFEGNKEKGFLTSSRRGGKGVEDIYVFNLPPLKLTVKGLVEDEKTETPLVGAKITIRGSDGTVQNAITDETGAYHFDLKPNTDYQLMASKEKFLNGKAGTSTKGIEEDKDFELDIMLKSIQKSIKIPNIFYEYTKSDLLPESMVALDKLVEILNDNPRIIIELGANTDFRGGEDANRKLSQKRAESVVDFLVSKGVDRKRLIPKGYGEDKPAIVSKEDAKKNSFLKAGTILSEDFIKGLARQDQIETAHQLNRRTEFKVLRTDYQSTITNGSTVKPKVVAPKVNVEDQ